MIIYKITNTINNKIYIGQDSKNNPKYFGSGKLIKQAIKKYGKKFFIKEILEYVDDVKNLDIREEYWIKEFNSRDNAIGYNISIGGKSTWLGKKFTDEHRENISKSLLGKKHTQERKDNLKKNHADFKAEKNPFYKKHHTEKTKELLREANSGENSVFYGKKFSDEHREKIAKHNRLRKPTKQALNAAAEKNRKKVYKLDLNCNFIKEYDSMQEAANDNNLFVSNISACCYKKNKSCGGFRWEFAKKSHNI